MIRKIKLICIIVVLILVMEGLSRHNVSVLVMDAKNGTIYYNFETPRQVIILNETLFIVDQDVHVINLTGNMEYILRSSKKEEKKFYE